MFIRFVKFWKILFNFGKILLKLVYIEILKVIKMFMFNDLIMLFLRIYFKERI